ncbi:hypothetical protein BH18ACI1_BH18ACI1_15540 [soil metagenome]
MFISKVFSFFFICMLAVCGNFVSQTDNVNQTQQTDETKFSLRMERTPCFGNCPIYTLIIQPDGKAILEDVKFIQRGDLVTKKGRIEIILSQDKIQQIISEIDKADFFSLKDSYTGDSGNCSTYWTDSPTVTLSVKLRGKEKTIPHYLAL